MFQVSDLITQLTQQGINIPEKLEKVTAKLQEESAKKDDLLGLRSLNEKVISLKEKDIPTLEEKLSELDKVIISHIIKLEVF